jgi:hypothetical protein
LSTLGCAFLFEADEGLELLQAQTRETALDIIHMMQRVMQDVLEQSANVAAIVADAQTTQPADEPASPAS